MPPGPGQGQQARALEEAVRLGQHRLAPDEVGQLHRQVVGRRIKGPQRRELVGHAADDELADALRPGEVLEAVLAQVAQRRAFGQGARDQRAGRVGQDHLAAMSRAGDARRAVHVEAHVIGVRGDHALARVQAHAHPHGRIRPARRARRARAASRPPRRRPSRRW